MIRFTSSFHFYLYKLFWKKAERSEEILRKEYPQTR
jgi:hypothetical protein